MSKRKKKISLADLPPPPETGGTHTWNGTAWVTTDQTADPAAPSPAPVEEAAPAAEPPVNEA